MRLTILLLIIALAGCTTLRPIDPNPADLSQRIASGEPLKRGDHMLIVTKDGETHEFDVTSPQSRYHRW